MASFKDFLRTGLTGTCENTYQYDPFFKGTFFVKLTLPADISSKVGNLTDLFAKTVLAVTLPTPTIAELEAPGIGGLKTMHAGSISLGNDLPVRLRETYDADIIKGISQWHNLMRSWKTGTSQVELRSSNYKGVLSLILTSPSAETYTLGYKFLGVWPTNDPLASLGADINDTALAELDVTFKFDEICDLPKDEAKKIIEEIK